MGWSWRIGRIAGIDLYVHPTFLLLLMWVALAHYFAHRSRAEALYGLGFILALFGIVVLHELGHALTARRYGIRTRDITLLPIGGVARLERIPEVPSQELAVALAGPAVNVVMAAAIYLGLVLGQGLAPDGQVLRVGGGFVQQLFWVNVSLVVFNMVPAFPMDGGRVLRALLAMRLDYVRATQMAASIGQAIALVFGLLGLFFNPFLIFIALFVWLAGAQEAGFVEMRSALGVIPVMRAMITDFRTLQPDDPLAQAVEHLLAGFQQDFPVVEDGRLVGVLTRNDLAAALGATAPRPVSATSCSMTSSPPTRERCSKPPSPGSRTATARTLPVVKDGRLLGLLTADHLAEVLMIQEALREASRPAAVRRASPHRRTVRSGRRRSSRSQPGQSIARAERRLIGGIWPVLGLLAGGWPEESGDRSVRPEVVLPLASNLVPAEVGDIEDSSDWPSLVDTNSSGIWDTLGSGRDVRRRRIRANRTERQAGDGDRWFDHREPLAASRRT